LVEGLSAEAPDIHNWAAAMNDKPDGYAYIDIFSGDSDVRRLLPGLAAFADDLAEALRRRGSKAGGTLHAVCPRGYEEDRSLIPKVWECLHISERCRYKHYRFFPNSNEPVRILSNQRRQRT